MAYTFKRVDAEWFMGFRRLDLDLTRHRGLTLIAGERAGAGRSNGASKSTLFEALHWCTFGRLIRKQRLANKVMHRWMPDGERTVVRVTMDVDGREVVIERARTKSGTTLRLHEAGRAAASTVDGVQRRIEALIGKDARAFGFTDMFSGVTAQFCQLTDAERKAVLESMTGADRYHVAAALAGDRLTKVQARAALMAERVVQLQARTEQAIIQRQGEVQRCVAASAAALAEEGRLRREANVASVRADKAADALGTYHAERNQTADAQGALRARYARAAAEAEGREKAARDKLSRVAEESAVLRTQVRAVEDELRTVRAEERPDKCPRCGQAWPADRAAASAHAEAEAARLSTRLEALRAQAGPATVRHSQLTAQVDEAIRDRRAAQGAAAELDRAADTGRERGLLSAYLAAEAELGAAQRRLREHRDHMPEDGGLEVDTSDLDRQLQELRGQTADARGEVVDAGQEAARLEFWKRGFGRGGLPSMLLDSSVPAMNEAVGRVASLLSYGELSVSFDPAAAKGKGDVFAVNVSYADGSDDYDMSSSGEHTRVDVAVLFALRDLIERRGTNTCTQLFLDEVLNGTDAAFADAFVAMLRSQYGGKDVFIISHDDAIKAHCDGTITVRKVGREAQVA